MMTGKSPTKLLLALACIFILFSYASSASATEIVIPDLKAKPGQTIELPIVIDEIDNLAGVRLVLKYDTAVLTYKKASKSNHTSSLMHIVNDRKPGILIIVMAGAKGIRGKNLPIFTLVFEVSANPAGNRKSKLQITESQLMSDKLKNVAHTVKTALVVISGGVSEP